MNDKDIKLVMAENEVKSKIISQPPKKENVVCKMMLTGKPANLQNVVNSITGSLNVYSNGRVDFTKTKTYAMTLMIEEIGI